LSIERNAANLTGPDWLQHVQDPLATGYRRHEVNGVKFLVVYVVEASADFDFQRAAAIVENQTENIFRGRRGVVKNPVRLNQPDIQFD